MAVLKILDVNQPSLRARCKKLSRITPSDRRLLDDMVETMRAAHGIGLAAPQVGVTQRLIVVEVDEELYLLVNPEVSDTADETDIMREGCLSLPDYYGPVERPIRATIRAEDPNGKKVKIKAEGLLARALQHEIDHLDGILFFDPQRMRSLSDLRYEPPTEDDNQDSDDEGRSGDGSEDGRSSRRARRSRVGSASSASSASSAPAGDAPQGTSPARNPLPTADTAGPDRAARDTAAAALPTADQETAGTPA